MSYSTYLHKAFSICSSLLEEHCSPISLCFSCTVQHWLLSHSKAKKSLFPPLCSSVWQTSLLLVSFHSPQRRSPAMITGSSPSAVLVSNVEGKTTGVGCLGLYETQWTSSKRQHELIEQNTWQEFRFQGRWVPPEKVPLVKLHIRQGQ